MEKDRNTKQKEINVPMDVMMDVASIIIETEMQSSISGINENKNVIQITLRYPGGMGYYQKAIENIEAILLDYRHYRHEEEDGDWRDN